jgi:hypothetical protein
VADMIHLLAELVENATLFSPSTSRVEVRAERVANGFAIEIDDRGLGIEAGQLRTINQQLAKPPDFDLANADQLGLFVVGKLAARHAVRVALRPSPYGGTTAVVLMPNSIVVPVSETDADTDPGLRPGTDRMPALDLNHADALALPGRHPAQPSLTEDATRTETPDGGFGLARDPAPTVPPPSFRLGSPPPRLGTHGPPAPGPGTHASGTPRPAAPGPGTHASGTPRPAAPGPGTPAAGPPGLPASGLAVPGPGIPGPGIPGPGIPGLGRPDPAAVDPDPFGLRGTGAAPAPATDASAHPGPAPGPQGAGTYRGLPRRIRQASLNPHLRDSPRAAARGADDDGTPPSLTRSPEEARSLVASLQSGWQRGREGDARDGEPADTAQGAGRQDSEAPRGEEALWMSRDWPDQASS